MTEQVRTIDRSRITGRAGRVDPVCRNEIARTLRRLLMRPRPFSG
jgi:mRNA-degrading endonuclease toxin of MazEF toxin-antitoxin module